MAESTYNVVITENYTIEKSSLEPVEPTFDVIEDVFPFDNFEVVESDDPTAVPSEIEIDTNINWDSEFVYSRYIKQGKTSLTYKSPKDYDHIKFIIPTEAGNSTNRRYGYSASVGDNIGTNCLPPIGNFNLYYCEVEISNISKDDVIKLESYGEYPVTYYTILGTYKNPSVTFRIEQTVFGSEVSQE